MHAVHTLIAQYKRLIQDVESKHGTAFVNSNSLAYASYDWDIYDKESNAETSNNIDYGTKPASPTPFQP
jgi:hypothetical protein